jgi:2-keto-4-pentenoate hydratase/2-oxohepta-3-ene-1,7-dioic acid hydratase in catechol pathway
MRFASIPLVGAFLLALTPMQVSAQATESAEPFFVATFEVDGAQMVGLILRNQLAVDIDAANRNLQQNPAFPEMTMPEDMLQLIGLYEYGLKSRLYEIVNHLVEDGMLAGGNRPSFIHDLGDVDIQAPIQYPGKILNAAGNFYTHICEGCTPEELEASNRERAANRGVPYLFLKPARGAVIGTGENIVIPEGRNRTDWEIEFGTVIGRTGKYIPAQDAQDYVFGYMVTIDISDRGGRPPGGSGSGSDWFVGKGHDTFAPQGPWIVPKEFYGDPMERLHQVLTIDGVTVQEARAGDMIFNVWELMEYASSLITLFPGDVVNSGTTGGTSMAGFETGVRSGYLEPGERIEATIEGIGTLVHEVVAGEPPPSNLSGAQLPPVDSYRPRN